MKRRIQEKKEQQISMEHLGDDLKIQRSIPSAAVISSCFYRPHLRFLEDWHITRKISVIELFEQLVEKSFQRRF